MKFLRTIALIFLIFAGGILIYKIMYEVKKGNLASYAETIGHKLISMVKAETGKKALAELYQEFLDQIQQKKASPLQVEQTAANILNLTNASDTLSPEQLEAVLQFAALTREFPQTPEVFPTPEVSEAASAAEWQEMEHRVKLAFEFNEKILEQKEKLALSSEEMLPKISYEESGGLKIVLDKKFHDEFRSLNLELKKLEKANLIVWKEIFVNEKEKELNEIKLKINQVKNELIEKDIAEASKIKEIKILQSLEKLDSLGLPPPVNVKIIINKVEEKVTPIK
jgi:hypothetical protein